MRPTFSVLMAAYDTEDYIDAAVRSVIGQTRRDWELIVIDDGSPDAVVERVKPFLADSRIRLIRQSNQGLGAALNTAAAVAAGRLLAKLDSDDLMRPEYLASVGALLEARPEIGLVSCDALMLQEPDLRVRRRTYLQHHSAYPAWRSRGLLSSLLRQNFIYPGPTIRREVFERLGGFDPDPGIVEDWDLWLRLAAARIEIEIIPRPLAVYRLRANSLSRDATGADRLWPRVEQTLRKARDELALSPDQRRTVRRALARFEHDSLLRRSRAALVAGRHAEARRIARAALAAWPSGKAVAITATLGVAPGLVRAVSVRKHAMLPWVRSLRLPRAPGPGDASGRIS